LRRYRTTDLLWMVLEMGDVGGEFLRMWRISLATLACW
jgi:hypothetical protein